MANYENRLSQNFIKTALTEGILCQFVVGKRWKESNHWIFLNEQKPFFKPCF